MFERYTEKARRVIFFSRYEASASGSDWITPAHLLLGLTREAPDLFLRNSADLESIRKSVKAEFDWSHPPQPTSVDLPLDTPAKRVLAFAAEEADRLRHRFIGTVHLLLGLDRVVHDFVQHHTGFDQTKLDEIRARAEEFEEFSRADIALGARPGGRMPAEDSTDTASAHPIRPEREVVLRAVAVALREPEVTIRITTAGQALTYTMRDGRIESTLEP